MTALPPDVVADLKQENARLSAELRAARDRQAASAEILRAIASTPGDAERPLQQIAETTARLFDCHSVRIRIAENGEWVRTIAVGASAERISAEVSATQGRIGGRNLPSTVVLENRQIHIPDMDNLDPAMADWPGLPPARAAGTRTIAGTPLRREGNAIENARLFNEAREALERQTATAEILKVIASSPSDVQPVFEAIAESAKRLSEGHSATVTRVMDDKIHLAAFTAGSEVGNKELQSSFPTPLSSSGIHSRVARTGELAFRADMETEPDVTPGMKKLARARGYRSILVVPMLREGVSIGTIGVTRRDPGPFAGNVIDLLQTFADQAVIAIENARLFNEVQAKTRDLSEALTYQTGSSNILRVIASSPTDVGPVLKAIVESACELCDAKDAVVHLRGGDDLRYHAHHGPIPVGMEIGPINRTWTAGRAFLDLMPVHVHDVLSAEGDQFPEGQRVSRRHGTRTILSVPLLRENESIGTIVLRRTEVNPFSDKQIALLQTFADQAVIALATSACSNRSRNEPGNCRNRSMNCAPRRIDWCRPRS